jgi:hypothetical protein
MTDHRVQALEHLEDAKYAHDQEVARTRVAMAQVHATMAQTEQLRIGNLIAWTSGSGFVPSPAVLSAVNIGLDL